MLSHRCHIFLNSHPGRQVLQLAVEEWEKVVGGHSRGGNVSGWGWQEGVVTESHVLLDGHVSYLPMCLTWYLRPIVVYCQ